MSLFKESVQPVDLGGDCVHDGLAVGGTVVEKQVQQSVVGEMSQSADAGQSDPLDVPAEGGVKGQHTSISFWNKR